MNEPVRPLWFTISSHSLYQGIVKNEIFKFLLYTFSIYFCKSLIKWLKPIEFQIDKDKMIKSVNYSGKSKCLDRKIPKKVPWALNFNISLMIYLNFWEKKCILGNSCSLYQVWNEFFIHYIKAVYLVKFEGSWVLFTISTLYQGLGVLGNL